MARLEHYNYSLERVLNTSANWTLSDSKFLQVTITLLSILTDFNDAVVWMVSSRPLISKSSSPCTNPLVTVPRSPIQLVSVSL